MRIFPATNIWNTPADTLPALANSDAMVATINNAPSDKLRCDDVMPLNFVSKPPMRYFPGVATPPNGDWDVNPFGVPDSPVVEPGPDAHCIVIDTANNLLYEFYQLGGTAPNFTAAIGCKWDLSSNALRPFEMLSADAAGLPIAPGVVQYADILAGAIKHCLRMSASPTLGFQYQWPAQHYASHVTDANVPPMGQRFRLKSSFDLSGFTGQALMILQAMKKYGAMLADNGITWAMQHDQDPRWDAADLLQLHNVPGSAMEAVDVSSLMLNSAFGMAASQPTATQLVMMDRFGRMSPCGSFTGNTPNGPFSICTVRPVISC